jgi:hypothetical protein
MKRILLQLFVLLLSTNAFSQFNAENFSYGTPTATTADTLTNSAFGGSVWRRHSGTGNPITYKGTSLSFPGYASSNIGGSVGFKFLSSSAEDANRSITPYTSGQVYVSFLLNMSNAGGTTADYFFFIMDTSAITSFRGRHYIKSGSAANTFNIGINKGSSATPVYSPTNYALDSTLLIVIKYSFHPTANDTIYTFIFPAGSTIPSVEPTPTLVTTDISTADIVTLNAVGIRQGTTGTMIGTIDGIRVSNSWTNSPLPVKFVSFNGLKNEDGSTILNWSTSSEINNKGFEVEASSNGKEFTTIGFVEGMGNSNAINRYEYQVFENRATYFRLRQIDFDGQSNYSEIISVKGADEEIQFSPNPFSDKIQISTKQEINLIEVIDMTGKVVISQIPEANQFSLNTTEVVKWHLFC